MKNRKVLRSSSIQSYRKEEEEKKTNNTPINHESIPQKTDERGEKKPKTIAYYFKIKDFQEMK